ncbi:proline--tRNA ligase [Paenibacillus sp. 1P07SE]|uniref:proline--tRNA ligase n=1 Tax=Paenibacillus sp. 1P07SE TaxID=3132209 RepID=UPI0039A6B160
MRQSNLLIPTLREAPADAEAASHALLLRGGYIRPLAAGIYIFLPLGLRVLRSIERIIREELDRIGAQELLMPALQPAELWQASGRYSAYGPELIRLQDRHGRPFVLGPTHEEVITALAGQEIRSYRQLPITLYQIQTKYRDERRPRFGLLRGREFVMKDAYSFGTSWEEASRSYQGMHAAYNRIFKRCGLRFRAVEADPGTIGGEGGSHEFIALAEIGEDTIASCGSCGYAANLEKHVGDYLSARAGDSCPQCEEGVLSLHRGIEVGHVFKLGTKYSQAVGASYLDDQGQEQPMIMGCYSIGVSRLLAAIVEQHHEAQGIRWPGGIAPFQVHLIPVSVQDEQQMRLAGELYEQLRSMGIETLLDDRDERPGVKFKDADLIGVPIRIVVGKEAGSGRVEYTDPAHPDKQTTTAAEAASLASVFLASLISGDIL